MRLTPEQGRVVGCLVEKQLTTPQAYPLTDNALIAACNQTTSRDPVVSYDLTTVRVAVRGLRQQGLVRTVHRPGERSEKHQHELPAALELTTPQVAVLAVLLLRGPQTAAELRARTERMHPFGSVTEVEQVLGDLAGAGLAERLPRQAGRREDRFAETLVEGGGPDDVPDDVAGAAHGVDRVGGTPRHETDGQQADRTVGTPPAAPTVGDDDGRPDDGRSGGEDDDERSDGQDDDRRSDTEDRLAELAEEVAMLREEVAALRERLEQLTG